ncbi:hypothetical protein EEZ25_21985 [Micromonospora aurantiaca]|uniref:helicase associated domain-containing protein n=1 Tax=Micromonospora aurantiaca (nom. illeg.) TaxID=47850 RepID=UPI000F3F9552|nr:helicase associated domain-containing protein [Micromonospora aurantiaca]RNH99665.1 hypothetical protein EEZ25_21985 [Micromonospora aurantiaca]
MPGLVDADTSADARAAADGYHTIWQVVRALRAHDETLAATLDQQRQHPSPAQAPPEQIVVRLPDAYDVEQYLRHLTVRLVTATTSRWWEGYGAAVRHHGTHGHLHIPIDHITDDGYPLGQWIHLQRKTRRAGRLNPQRVQALDTLGMLWDPRATRWERGAIHAAAFRAHHGHLRVAVDHITGDGYPLGAWIRMQRRAHHAGTLDPAREEALQRLGIEWDPYQAMWDRGISHAAAYRAEYGHLRVPADHTCPDGYRLGQFVIAQRMLRKRGTLSPARIAHLDNLDMMWDKRDHAFINGLAHARAHYDAHDTLSVTTSTRSPDGYRLGAWLQTQRAKLRNGTMPAENLQALDAITTTWR